MAQGPACSWILRASVNRCEARTRRRIQPPVRPVQGRSGNRSAAAFGTITQTYDPRQVQFGMKVMS